MSATMGGFLLGNAPLTHWHGWHYSGRALVGGQGLAVAALLLFSFTDAYAGLMAAQIAFGAVLGLTYFSSIYYGMEAGGSTKGHGGRHEAIIGAACGVGPFVGGWLMLALAWNRAAFPASALFIVAIAAWQTRLMTRRRDRITRGND